jgi:hypothetical protein
MACYATQIDMIMKSLNNKDVSYHHLALHGNYSVLQRKYSTFMDRFSIIIFWGGKMSELCREMQ